MAGGGSFGTPPGGPKSGGPLADYLTQQGAQPGAGLDISSIMLLIQAWSTNTQTLSNLVQQLSTTVTGDVTGSLPGPLNVVSTHLAAPLPISQGGTGNTTGQPSGNAGGDLTGVYPSPQIAGPHDWALLGFTLISVDFDSGATDNLITIAFPAGKTRYQVNTLAISGASATLSTATFGLFTGAGGGGAAVIPAGTAITVTTAADATANNMQIVAGPVDTSYMSAQLFFRVGTPEGAPATGNVSVLITFLP